MEDKLKTMKKSNDLSDIVLEKEESSAEKTKKILLLAASLILLFLIALVVIKLFSGGKPENQLATEEPKVEQVVQKVDENLEQPAKEASVEESSDLFTQEPIIDENSETDLKFEEMVRRLKAQDATETQEPAQEETIKEVVEKKTEPKVIEPKVVEVTQKPKESKEIKETKVVPSVIEVVKEKPKPVSTKIKKEVIVSSVIEKPRQSTTKLSSLSGYFIQVGATANQFPNRSFLRKIKNAGFDYIVHSVTIKGRAIKKVLVGPYTSRAQAKAHLPEARAKINPDAYIFRIK